VFFKSFLELDGANMASILSFVSKSLSVLLNEKYSPYFQSEYPLFYKNKITKSNNKEKFFYRSAIDNALKNNQIRAIGYIIKYMVKYQNNYTSSFLFSKTMPSLISKGVEVSSLLNSQIFSLQFDYDEWPTTHTDDSFYMRSYNDSLFDLRKKYRKIFWEDHFEIKNEEDEVVDSSKLYKVSYKINLLPILSEYILETDEGSVIMNEGISVTSECVESDELAIFEVDNF